MSMSLLAQLTAGTTVKPKSVVKAVKENPALAADVDPQTGNTPLHLACCNRAPLAVVEALLAANPAAARTPDGEGNLAVHGAVASGCGADVVSALQHSPRLVYKKQIKPIF